MLIIPVLVVALAAAVSSYVLLVCLVRKVRPRHDPAHDAPAPVAHRAAALQGSVPEADRSVDAGQDASYHPPPVPVVVLDPDGRVTVAYLLRVSNQSYLVTQKSEEGGTGSRASCSLGDRSLSLPTTLPPGRSLSLPASQPAERSLSPPPGWPASSSLTSAFNPTASAVPAEQHTSHSLPAGVSSGYASSASLASSGSGASSSAPGCSDWDEDGSGSDWAGSEPDIECGLPGPCDLEERSVEKPSTPVAAERRRSSASTGGLPAVEACVQAWAPACE